MLLSLQPPNPMQTDIKPHEYSTFHKSTTSRYSPPESPRNLPSFFDEGRMSNPHRGLPLPAGLNLPPPDRGASTAPILGHLPAPPSQWTGQDDSMRSWLHAKAEEDRRKQEEEKTKQETLRLDQRRIEQSMLRDSLQGGIPPPMVPLIFAGMGGGNLPGHTLEWAQQYLASLSIQNQQQQQQIQAQQQQLQQQQQQGPPPPAPLPPHMSPDVRRDTRMIPANPYGGHQALQSSQPNQQLPSQQPPPPPPPPPPSSSLGRPMGSATSSQSTSALSRLNTTEFVPHVAEPSASRQVMHPLQQSQSAQSDQGSAPGLFFHHWTPPNPSSSGSNQPATPSGKSAQGSPFSQQQQQQSHLRVDHQNSPKKRKATGNHPAPPAPTSQPSDPSPPFSSRSSGERETSPGNRSRPRPHSRHLSNASSHDFDTRNVARPSSRQQRQDELSGGGSDPRRQLTGSSSGTSGDENPNRVEGMKTETR